jgi:hypothetical protein
MPSRRNVMKITKAMDKIADDMLANGTAALSVGLDGSVRAVDVWKPAPQELVPDALVKAAQSVCRLIHMLDAENPRALERRQIRLLVSGAIALEHVASHLPRTTIEEAKAQGAVEERERLANTFAAGKLAEGNSIIHDVPAFIRAQTSPHPSQ